MSGSGISSYSSVDTCICTYVYVCGSTVRAQRHLCTGTRKTAAVVRCDICACNCHETDGSSRGVWTDSESRKQRKLDKKQKKAKKQRKLDKKQKKAKKHKRKSHRNSGDETVGGRDANLPGSEPLFEFQRQRQAAALQPTHSVQSPVPLELLAAPADTGAGTAGKRPMIPMTQAEAEKDKARSNTHAAARTACELATACRSHASCGLY